MMMVGKTMMMVGMIMISNEYVAHNRDSGELFILIIACCVVS
jgi:hypothetical protein